MDPLGRIKRSAILTPRSGWLGRTPCRRRPLGGWRCCTLTPSSANRPSTREVLEALYDKVVADELFILDDCGVFVPYREAVDEFRAQRGITEPLCRAGR